MEEWEDLYHDSPLATPFQSWAWLYSWWESYGEDYELRLVAMRDEKGLLVGLMPLMLQRQRGLTRLLFIGTGITEYLDILARKGWEARVAEAGLTALKQMGSWQVTDLQELRPEAVAWSIFQRWHGHRARLWQSSCPVIAAKPWNELLVSVSRNLRSTVRRALRRAKEDRVRVELASVEDAERAARRFVGLHHEMWRGRNIAPEHLTKRFESHIVAAACRMTACGLGGISEFWRDGEVVASHFLILGQNSVGHYLSGATNEALQRYQMSSLYICDGVTVARDRQSAYFDLLRGEESYKLRWNPRIVLNHRAVMGRDTVLWGLYAGYHHLRSRARRYEKAERTPQWIKEAAETARSLRSKARQSLKEKGLFKH
jgi:CelD/BcsL family acetyltransferase involved in cellulose biosynthesis